MIESKGIYQHTLIQTGAVVPIDYNSLAREIETDDEHSAIVRSHSSSSYRETEAFVYMAEIPEEIAKKFEEQARVQKAQHEMLQVQQESINDLKKMVVLLLKSQRRRRKV